MLIVDASALVGFILADEDPVYPGAVMTELRLGGATVPAIFWLEIRNVLMVGERRGRIDRSTVDAFLAGLDQLPIRFEAWNASRDALALARQHRITVTTRRISTPRCGTECRWRRWIGSRATPRPRRV